MGRAVCWIELRYGWDKASVVVARSANPYLLRMLKEELLAEAKERARQGQAVDEMLGMMHRADLVRLAQLLEKLIPN